MRQEVGLNCAAIDDHYIYFRIDNTENIKGYTKEQLMSLGEDFRLSFKMKPDSDEEIWRGQTKYIRADLVKDRK